jgi:NADPH2:quinone reductase
MKAAWYNEFGSADDVLNYANIETPVPKQGEVLVRLKSSGINPSDVKKRAGSSPTALDAGPIIPHSDGSGLVEAVGSGVNSSRVGQKVWVYNAQYGRQLGTAAEYISINSSQAVEMTKSTSFEVGACLGIPAMTAHRCVTADGPVTGKTILVTGGAGRVGYYAIQFGKLFGARVIATAGSEESRKHCNDAGADLVTSHPSKITTEEIKEYTGGEGVERIVDCEFGGNLNDALDVIKTNGVIATYASMAEPNPAIPFYRMMFMDLTVRLVLVYCMPDEAKINAINDITDYLKKDELKHRIAHRIPLSEIMKGHKIVEDGSCLGCVILDCES